MKGLKNLLVVIMKIKILGIIFLFTFLTGCATVTRNKKPNLETENQKLQARIAECEATIQDVAKNAKVCEEHYKGLLHFVILCSEAGERIYANPATQTLSCGKPE